MEAGADALGQPLVPAHRGVVGGRNTGSAWTGGTAELPNGLAAPSLVPAGDEDPRTAGRQPLRGEEAYAGGGAGDENGMTLHGEAPY